ncbi:MAG: hypothetical protein ACTSYS_02350 [Promethearchaeota archaeon]
MGARLTSLKSALHVALQEAAKQDDDANIGAILPDIGKSYLSTNLWE